VPFILYWKGKITAGSVSDIPVTISDIYPTIAKALNSAYKKDKAVEGESILDLLANTNKSNNRTLYWHYPHYSNQGGKPGSAIRKENLKLIYNYEDQSVELYDVVNDVSEKNNLAAAQPKVVKQMQTELMQWLKKNERFIPT
jgi:Arylsulfatase A and related enzymes